MSEIVVQPLEETYLDGWCNVLSLTYRNGDPLPEDKRTMDPPDRHTFIARRGSEVLGGFWIHDMTATRGPATLPCAAVAAVAVLPELRRSGVGTTLLRWLARDLSSNGTSLASLYPFRETYYRRFGYEVAGKRLRITCPIHRWPKLESNLPVRRLTPSAWESLAECYDAFAHRRSGLNIRSERHWMRVLAENRELTIYAVGQPVEAYAVVSHQSGFWTSDHISELVWNTRRGYEGILATLAGLGINKDSLSWHEPSDGPYYFEYMDQGLETKLERPIMYRVNDVPTALRSLKPDAALSGQFTIGVDDPIVSTNVGPWEVGFRDGSVTVEHTKRSSQPGLKMSIRHFTQAFLGEPSLLQLADAEYIDVESKRELGAAATILPAQATYCLDFF